MKIINIVLISLLLSSCTAKRPNIYIPAQQPAAPTLKFRPQVALALGGGGARGFAHIGVLKAFEENHIPIDLITGCSAGSLVGSLYADSVNSDRVKKIMMNANFWNFADVSNNPFKGLMSGYNLESFLLENLQAKDFKNLRKKLAVTTTNLKTGQPYIIEGGPIPPAVLASSAIPGVVQPIHMYGNVLVDGGVAQPVPVMLAKKYNPKMIIAINIDDDNSTEIPNRSIEVFEKSFTIIYHRSTLYSLYGADIIIHPKLGEIGTFELSAKEHIYQLGYQAAIKAMPKIKAKLAEKGIDLEKNAG